MLDNFQDDYFIFLEKKFSEIYQIATKARSKGIDAVHEPESVIAKDLSNDDIRNVAKWYSAIKITAKIPD